MKQKAGHVCERLRCRLHRLPKQARMFQIRHRSTSTYMACFTGCAIVAEAEMKEVYIIIL